MTAIALELRGLRKRYRDTIALDGLDLDVRRGELLALVGPSGCGKTTALHLIAGLLDPDDGDVRFAGKSWRQTSPAERNVALVFQDGALYPHLTVRENLEFPLRARRRLDADAVAQTAARLGLERLLDRRPHELSGGEAQRVALGRALIRRPNLLLLDEPLTNLDRPLREKLRGLIRDLVLEFGVTAIFVTHDQGEAMAVGDRVAVLRDGRLVQIDTAEAIYDHPEHAFVAGFFGSPAMNLLPGRRAGTTIGGAWGELAAPPGPGDAVLVGFHAEAGSLSEMPPGLAGTLARVEPQGPIKVITVALPGGEVRLRLHRDKTLPPLGSPLWLRVDAADLHIFDAATEARL
jgi:multiple sugar transport system ATP-binding protein